MSKKVLFIVLIAVAAIGFGGWKLMATFKKAAQSGGEAVARFHTLYNAGADTDIYREGTARFRAKGSEAEWSNFTNILHRKLGAHQSGVQEGLSVNNQNGDQTMTMKYSAVYEKGAATESFVYDYNGDRPLLRQFDIQSPLLLP